MTDFEKFVRDNTGRYAEGEEMNRAYDRSVLASNSVLISREQFAEEAGERYELTADKVYDRLAALVNNGRLKPRDVYAYARYQWCLGDAEAIVAHETEPGVWVVNNCDHEICAEKAALKVNEEFGFEASRVQIVGKPYYEATDWQFIRFNCRGRSWLWANGEIFKTCT